MRAWLSFAACGPYVFVAICLLCDQTCNSISTIAFIICSLFRYPLDVIKTRAQLGHGNSSFGTIISSLRAIQQKEGFRTLYRGISAPMSIEPVKRVSHPLESLVLILLRPLARILPHTCCTCCQIHCKRSLQRHSTPRALVQLVCIRRACRHDRMLFHRRARNRQGSFALAPLSLSRFLDPTHRFECRARHTSACTSTRPMVFQKYYGRKVSLHSHEDLSHHFGAKAFGTACESF